MSWLLVALCLLACCLRGDGLFLPVALDRSALSSFPIQYVLDRLGTDLATVYQLASLPAGSCLFDLDGAGA